MQQGIPRLIEAHDKALCINLDPTRNDIFAEMGAGQEVARWFLRVGGAAGAIASWGVPALSSSSQGRSS